MSRNERQRLSVITFALSRLKEKPSPVIDELLEALRESRTVDAALAGFRGGIPPDDHQRVTAGVRQLLESTDRRDVLTLRRCLKLLGLYGKPSDIPLIEAVVVHTDRYVRAYAKEEIASIRSRDAE